MQFKNKSMLLVTALVLLLSFTLSACGGSGNSKVLRVGVDDSYPPMEYKDADGKTTIGFDVDVAKEIGKRMNKDVEFVSTAWDGVFAALEADKFDCIISSCSINDEREKNHSLTKAYIANKLVMVTSKANTDIKSPQDLKGKKVGAQTGTTSSDYVEKELIPKGVNTELSKYDLVTQPFADLKVGRIDAIIVDIVVAKYYLAKDKESFKVAWESPDSEPMAICCQKKGTALRDQIDKILNDMRTDGSMKKISEKWFGEDVTNNLK